MLACGISSYVSQLNRDEGVGWKKGPARPLILPVRHREPQMPGTSLPALIWDFSCKISVSPAGILVSLPPPCPSDQGE